MIDQHPITRREFLARNALAAFTALPKIVTQSSGANSQFTTVIPEEDTEVILSNPNMGWCVYETYPLDGNPQGSSTLLTCPHDDFEGVDHVALMFSWADIERAEGVYDFSKTDQACDYWRKRGKKLMLRMSAESFLWWNNLNPPSGQGPPDYVVQRMPSDQRETRTLSGISYVELDARNPYYRKRLEAFLREVAKRFSEKRPVELIDLRGFGVWGEWHHGYIFNTLTDIPKESSNPLLAKRRANLKGILDIWSEAFSRNYLALSFSYDPDSPKEYYAGPTDHYDPAYVKDYEGYLRFSAFDYAMTKPNITLRRDGCGGAVHSNERLFNDRMFHTLQKGPMMSEFVGGYHENLKGGGKWIRWMVEDALSLHPNYINLMGWQSHDALAFMKEQPDIVRHGSNRMGYRLVPVSVTYPKMARVGASLELEMHWVNRAVGRAMRDYHLRLRLRDSEGRRVFVADLGALPSSKWIAGETYDTRIVSPSVKAKPGRYTLEISLFDPPTKRTILLPLKNGREGWYGIGEMKVVK